MKPGNPTGVNDHAAKNKGGNFSTIPLEDIEQGTDKESDFNNASDLPEPPRSAEANSTKKTKARDRAAAKVGVSGKTVDKAEKIAKAAPELFGRPITLRFGTTRSLVMKKKAQPDALF